MLERNIEAYLIKQVKAVGGTAYKFTSPQRRSVPDRMCLFPGGGVVFVELKAPGKKATKSQERELARLRELGFEALMMDSKEEIDIMVGDAKRRKFEDFKGYKDMEVINAL